MFLISFYFYSTLSYFFFLIFDFKLIFGTWFTVLGDYKDLSRFTSPIDIWRVVTLSLSDCCWPRNNKHKHKYKKYFCHIKCQIDNWSNYYKLMTLIVFSKGLNKITIRNSFVKHYLLFACVIVFGCVENINYKIWRRCLAELWQNIKS